VKIFVEGSRRANLRSMWLVLRMLRATAVFDSTGEKNSLEVVDHHGISIDSKVCFPARKRTDMSHRGRGFSQPPTGMLKNGFKGQHKTLFLDPCSIMQPVINRPRQ
jgi:hypothetical protein